MHIEEHNLVPNADILIGVPCYRDGPMVARCLRSLEEPGVQLLSVDNGSDPDVKTAISGRGLILRNAVNRYVNPAWNQIMEIFLARPAYDLLVIANSDLVLDAGWAEHLRAHRREHPQEQIAFGIDTHRRRRSAGSFFVMTRRAVLASYPIPDNLLVMAGDDFIFHVNLGVGHREYVIPSVTMEHVERGTYDKAPEIWSIAGDDTHRWNLYGLRELVLQRLQRILSLRTPRELHDHLYAIYMAHLDTCPTCDQNAYCAACAAHAPSGHACHCPEEWGGGGQGYRLGHLWEIAQRKMLLEEHRIRRNQPP